MSEPIDLTAVRAAPALRRRESAVPGRHYRERGRPVVAVIGWGPGGGPRNVLIRREDGTLVVRPFRGLRRPRPLE